MTSSTTVFLSATSLDLKALRDEVHKAFARAGLRVLTQDHSLAAPARGVLELLRSHIRASDFVVHFAGIAYGSAPDEPAFSEDPTFACSFTQFEYYYAHAIDKPVIAFVCGAEFPYQAFTETGASDADRARHVRLQEAHRDRVTRGVFDGTPLSGSVGRMASEPVRDSASLLAAVAAALGTIHQESDAARLDMEAAKRELGRLASHHERLLRRLVAIVSACALLAVVAAGIVLWQTREPAGLALAGPEDRLDALRYRKNSIVEAARKAVPTDPYRAALLLRELPDFLAEPLDVQLAIDLLSSHSASALHHRSSNTDPAPTPPLEPVVRRNAREADPSHASYLSWTGDAYVEGFDDGSERRWQSDGRPALHAKSERGQVALLTEDRAALVWFTNDRGAPRAMHVQGTSIIGCDFVSGAELIVLACADGRLVVRSPEPGVSDRTWQGPSAATALEAVSEDHLVVLVRVDDEVFLWEADSANEPTPMDGVNFDPTSEFSGSWMSSACSNAEIWSAHDAERLLKIDHGGLGHTESFGFWIADGNARKRLVRYDGRVTDVIQEDERRALTVEDDDREVFLWTFDRGGPPRRILRDDIGEIAGAWFATDRERVLVSTKRGVVWLARLTGFEPPRMLQGHTAEVRSAVFDSDGRWLMTTAEDGSARRWSLAGPADATGYLSLGDCYGDLMLSPDGSRVAGRRLTANEWWLGPFWEDLEVCVWRADLASPPLTIRPLARANEPYRACRLEGDPPDFEMCFDPLGEHLIVRRGSVTQTWSVDWRRLQARLWELEPTRPSPEERQQLLGFPPLVTEFPVAR